MLMSGSSAACRGKYLSLAYSPPYNPPYNKRIEGSQTEANIEGRGHHALRGVAHPRRPPLRLRQQAEAPPERGPCLSRSTSLLLSHHTTLRAVVRQSKLLRQREKAAPGADRCRRSRISCTWTGPTHPGHCHAWDSRPNATCTLGPTARVDPAPSARRTGPNLREIRSVLASQPAPRTVKPSERCGLDVRSVAAALGNTPRPRPRSGRRCDDTLPGSEPAVLRRYAPCAPMQKCHTRSIFCGER